MNTGAKHTSDDDLSGDDFRRESLLPGAEPPLPDAAAPEETRAATQSEPHASPLVVPISRRTALKYLRLIVGGGAALATAEAGVAALMALYNSSSNTFGGPINLGPRTGYAAALPDQCQLNLAGVFYHADARCYLVHLSAQTPWHPSGDQLISTFTTQDIHRDVDGSYWIALSQACTHEGVTVKFFPCGAFNCPDCGATFAVDGEYIDGPAPCSMDRYRVAFSGRDLVVDTGALNMSVQRPDVQARLLPAPNIPACFGFDQ